MELFTILLIITVCFAVIGSISDSNKMHKQRAEEQRKWEQKHNPITPYFYEYLHLILEIDIEKEKFIYAKKSNKHYSHYSYFPHENLLGNIYVEFCRFQTQHRGKYFDLTDHLFSPDLECRILAVEIMKANLKK